MAGRPSKLDDLRAKRILDAIAGGASRTAAAALGGISKATLMDYLARGRDGEPVYADFLARVKEAEAHVELAHLANIKRAGDDGSWQASAWFLERTRPADYAKREPTAEQEDARAESDGQTDLAVAESVVAALKSRKAS